MSLIRPINPAGLEASESFEDDDYLLQLGLNKLPRQLSPALLSAFVKDNSGIRFFRKHQDWTGTLTTSYTQVSSKTMTFTEAGLLLIWFHARVDVNSDTDGDENKCNIQLKLNSSTLASPEILRLSVAATAGVGAGTTYVSATTVLADSYEFTSFAKKTNADAGAALYGGLAHMLFIPGVTIE